MPQLDIYIISSQIFWLLIKFNVIYALLLETYIINFTSVFKARYKVIELVDGLLPSGPANPTQIVLE